jgi:hypothetical protein
MHITIMTFIQPASMLAGCREDPFVARGSAPATASEAPEEPLKRTPGRQVD